MWDKRDGPVGHRAIKGTTTLGNVAAGHGVTLGLSPMDEAQSLGVLYDN